jgi:hypothetical protein
MPEFLHPPYAATAKQYPKQLNRWLDVNAQNGPLERNQAYFVLPAFNLDATIEWMGYSNLVLAYNFEGPNNFSLKYLYQGAPNKGLLSPVPSNPNYSLAVMWIDKAGVVQRRFLWISLGSTFYFETQLYTNEKILKNFRLEIWDSNGGASQTAPLTFFTSVRGTQDYRFGIDFKLVNSDTAVTDFNATSVYNGNIGVSGLTGALAYLNGYYVKQGLLNGKPYYFADLNHDYVIYWHTAGGDLFWYINDTGRGDAFQSDQDVATPDLVTIWAVTGIGALPLPTVTKTYDFDLPLTFPANAVPQAN